MRAALLAILLAISTGLFFVVGGMQINPYVADQLDHIVRVKLLDGEVRAFQIASMPRSFSWVASISPATSARRFIKPVKT